MIFPNCHIIVRYAVYSGNARPFEPICFQAVHPTPFHPLVIGVLPPHLMDSRYTLYIKFDIMRYSSLNSYSLLYSLLRVNIFFNWRKRNSYYVIFFFLYFWNRVFLRCSIKEPLFFTIVHPQRTVGI